MIHKPLTSTAILDDCVKFNGKSVVGILVLYSQKVFCSWIKDKDPQVSVPTGTSLVDVLCNLCCE